MSDRALRLFFAIDLPAPVRARVAAALADLQREVGSGVRWIPSESLHLTLKFCGDVKSPSIPRLTAAAAARSARLDPFELGLGGWGAFPSVRSARIVWLGVTGGAPRLARLARKLDAAAGKHGVPRERRPYRAHLTVGRLRQAAPVALQKAAAPEIPPFPVEEVVLYESRLSPAGSTYVPLARLPLGESELSDADFAPEI
jgi:2'-5' RNA ligase